MPKRCLTPAHSRSSVPSMRKSEFATSTPLSGSGLINGIEAIILFGVWLKIMTSACRLFLEIRCKGTGILRPVRGQSGLFFGPFGTILVLFYVFSCKIPP